MSKVNDAKERIGWNGLTAKNFTTTPKGSRVRIVFLLIGIVSLFQHSQMHFFALHQLGFQACYTLGLLDPSA
jgi:hypothetical protein